MRKLRIRTDNELSLEQEQAQTIRQLNADIASLRNSYLEAQRQLKNLNSELAYWRGRMPLQERQTDDSADILVRSRRVFSIDDRRDRYALTLTRTHAGVETVLDVTFVVSDELHHRASPQEVCWYTEDRLTSLLSGVLRRDYLCRDEIQDTRSRYDVSGVRGMVAGMTGEALRARVDADIMSITEAPTLTPDFADSLAAAMASAFPRETPPDQGVPQPTPSTGGTDAENR